MSGANPSNATRPVSQPGGNGRALSLEARAQTSHGHNPARLNLSNSLTSGNVRNPLTMHQARASRSVMGSLDNTQQSLNGTQRPSNSNRAPPELGTTALRVKLPGYLNTPERVDDTLMPTSQQKYTTLKKIADLEILLGACRRSKKLREEGRCSFSLAVCYDNLKEYRKGIQHYTDFLRICRECEDKQGQALAYHCLAVSHQVLGANKLGHGPESKGNPAAPVKGGSGLSSATKGGNPTDDKATDEKTNERAKQELKTALYFHNKHRKLGDAVGKFIAHANLGICYGFLEEKDACMLNHQYALRYALQLHSIEGQSVAIKHLAVSSRETAYSGDSAKMKALIERYIELCDTLQQDQSQALKKLADVTVQQDRDFEKGSRYYSKALEAASEAGDTSITNSVLVSMGILSGYSKMDDYMRGLAGGCQ